MTNGKRTALVMPTHNAAKTLAQTTAELGEVPGLMGVARMSVAR